MTVVDTSTRMRQVRALDALALGLSLFLSLLFAAASRSRAVQVERVAPLLLLVCRLSELVLQLLTLLRFVRSYLPVAAAGPRWFTFQHFPPALTTARRSHDRPHNTSPPTEAPRPLISFNNSGAVDRARTERKHLAMCTSVNARVNCAVTKNRVHQGSGSRTLPAHRRLHSTCAFCAFVEVLTPLKFNKISGFW